MEFMPFRNWNSWFEPSLRQDPHQNTWNEAAKDGTKKVFDHGRGRFVLFFKGMKISIKE